MTPRREHSGRYYRHEQSAGGIDNDDDGGEQKRQQLEQIQLQQQLQKQQQQQQQQEQQQRRLRDLPQPPIQQYGIRFNNNSITQRSIDHHQHNSDNSTSNTVIVIDRINNINSNNCRERRHCRQCPSRPITPPLTPTEPSNNTTRFSVPNIRNQNHQLNRNLHHHYQQHHPKTNINSNRPNQQYHHPPATVSATRSTSGSQHAYNCLKEQPYCIVCSNEPILGTSSSSGGSSRSSFFCPLRNTTSCERGLSILDEMANLTLKPSQTIPVAQQTNPELIQDGKPKLIWLMFMHRHGDRTPLNMAPRDKYNHYSYWPEGFGMLTNDGRRRMFNLGKFIKKRYDYFLTDNFREIYSRSSDVERCIESSAAVLAGMYPPVKQFEWNPQLHWIPAPIHTVPAPEDYLLNEAGRDTLIDYLNELDYLEEKSTVVQALYRDSAEEQELLGRELGYCYDKFYRFKCTYSTLDIEQKAGLEMPAWYTPQLRERLYRFAGIAFGLAGGGTKRIRQIRCGYLMEDILNRMDLAPVDGIKPIERSEVHQPTNAPSRTDLKRVVHYSTHDSIVAAFLESLDLNSPNPIPPGFGATFFVELYVDTNDAGQPVGEKYIKLFYLDDTESEKAIERHLPKEFYNQKGQLTLGKFREYVSYLLPNQSS